jgi:hypothetical protein
LHGNRDEAHGNRQAGQTRHAKKLIAGFVLFHVVRPFKK